MRLVLIRHFQTPGNELGRYIGSTDEDLVPMKQTIQMDQYPKVDRIYVSPLKRCIQTANIIYPNSKLRPVEMLRECDFGSFENKNYQELGQNPEYQEWINSGGTMRFPQGEDPDEFRRRCREAFIQCVEECIREEIASVAFVVHGGTIMSIMSAFDSESKEFYDYHVRNGKGYITELRVEEWKQGIHTLDRINTIE